MAAKQFVGFGFGPIQSGLMLLEAQRSGRFGRFVVAEIDRALVDAVRGNGNRVVVNVAHADRIEQVPLTGIELCDPGDPADGARLAAAIHAADELATALPSVDVYRAGGAGSIAARLARNLNPRKPQILYASENHNHAAELLREAILEYGPADRLARVQALNTVIGKMSGVIRDPRAMEAMGLQPLAPGFPRAILVEAFNRILISRVTLPGVSRGITVFEEKDDLLPFEEAKLYGHNAVHALLGYLAAERGLSVMSEIRRDPALLETGRRAFLDESGAALVKKHGRLGDPLFTPRGYAAYAEDLLARMTNPFLNDAVARICRDPRRKLGYGDRLVGTMREALGQGVRPRLMAAGAAAALRYMLRIGEAPHSAGDLPADAALAGRRVRALLEAVWEGQPADEHREACVRLIEEAFTAAL